jgi:hypothetical protein
LRRSRFHHTKGSAIIQPVQPVKIRFPLRIACGFRQPQAFLLRFPASIAQKQVASRVFWKNSPLKKEARLDAAAARRKETTKETAFCDPLVQIF